MIFVKLDRKLMELVQTSVIEKAGNTALMMALKTSDADLTVVVTDDSHMRKLNKQFRSIAKTTDVLSFPSDETDPDSGKAYLGDVAISFQQALKQALQGGHPVENELQLLTVHGVLHLLGYDHGEKKDKTRMWKFQEKALEVLGLAEINILEE